MSPLGYVNVKGAGMVPDENIAPLIKKTFQAYATGNFTLRQLHDRFNRLGLSRKNGSKMLKWIYENTYYRLFVYLPRTRAKAS